MIINSKIEIDDIRRMDLHMHTIYCDGKNTPEEMVLAAIDKGLTCMGFSGHSYVTFDQECGMSADAEEDYRKEISRLKEKYAGQIRIFCGIELDYHSLPEYGTAAHEAMLQQYKETYDYIIGSVHYIPIPVSGKCITAGEEMPGDCTGADEQTLEDCTAAEEAMQRCFSSAKDRTRDCQYAAVDNTPEIFITAVEQHYGGDYYLAAEAYYALAANVVQQTDCDIIGHFDLISKFNQKYHFFDEQHPRYLKAWKQALDHLLPASRIFELNAGGITRGWRTVPYPAPQMQEYIMANGGRFIFSSDSHSTETIGVQAPAISYII